MCSSFIQQRNDEYKSPSDVEGCFYVGANYRIAYEHKTKNGGKRSFYQGEITGCLT